MAGAETMSAPENSISASVRPRTTARRWPRLWDGAAPYLMTAPVLILVIAFIYWPLFYSAYLSLFDWNFVRPDKTYVGLKNFHELWKSLRFHRALSQTGVYVAALVPIQVLLPLALALLLWPIRKSRAQSTYRVVLFTPTVISYSIGALLWLWIFNPLEGVINAVLTSFGYDRVYWLANPRTAIWCVIAVASWKTIGFNLLLYLAALEAVPSDLLEAASVDGATGWKQITSIRFPLITPTFFFVLVTTVIAVNDEVFGIINVLTDGGPFNKTENVAYYLYQQGFRFFQIGAASALSLVLFLAVVALTWLQFRFVERHVHYV